MMLDQIMGYGPESTWLYYPYHSVQIQITTVSSVVKSSRASISLPLGYSNFRDSYLSRSIELLQSWEDRYIQPHEYIYSNAECK